MFDLSHDAGSAGRPNKRTGIFVMFAQVLVDGPLKGGHAAEGSAPDALAGDLRKPALHQIQPGSPGGGEVQVVTRVSSKPGLYLRMGMRAVIVQDHMDLPPAGRGSLDAFQEPQELAVSLP